MRSTPAAASPAGPLAPNGSRLAQQQQQQEMLLDELLETGGSFHVDSPNGQPPPSAGMVGVGTGQPLPPAEAQQQVLLGSVGGRGGFDDVMTASGGSGGVALDVLMKSGGTGISAGGGEAALLRSLVRSLSSKHLGASGGGGNGGGSKKSLLAWGGQVCPTTTTTVRRRQ